MPETEHHRRQNAHDQYHKVLRIVEHQTGGEQPALVPRTSVRIVASHAGMDKDDARMRIQAAIENGDLLEWHGQVALIDEVSLETVRDEEIRSDVTRRRLVGKVNGLLQDLRRDDDE